MSPKQFALNTDSELIELEKDCGCLDEIHVGPHWIHMDRYDQNVGKEYLARAEAAHGTARVMMAREASVQHELARVTEKRRQFGSRGIECLLPVPLTAEALLKVERFRFNGHRWRLELHGNHVTIWMNGARRGGLLPLDDTERILKLIGLD